ncbi:thaumatin family-domain-containing protein [Pseudoneurospora amorphoporcata]|uniref:Thaumatin family-domain-containing protein n=1 Tax=Pseudoneurospora amorphoporcata TaxID=241081 RepID=A0AAN6SDS9_9PEZI|nr:thaumatin family-domain-containing protein [Pseudoneurospora amorphoporcata]
MVTEKSSTIIAPGQNGMRKPKPNTEGHSSKTYKQHHGGSLGTYMRGALGFLLILHGQTTGVAAQSSNSTLLPTTFVSKAPVVSPTSKPPPAVSHTSTASFVPIPPSSTIKDTSHPTSTPPNPTPIPIVITNSCPDTIWPGIGTQNGIGPGVGGFELAPGGTRPLFVGPDWQGRVWGRTNCSFNDEGTGPSNLNGVNGNGAACMTGDCFGRLDCEFTGQVPVTLAEFNLIGGMNSDQTFYDISLVDGYNLPIGIIYIPAANTTWIPPNLTNCVCIASAGFLDPPSRSGLFYTNKTFPIPWEPDQTNPTVGGWCPWDLQEYPPSKPGDGIYPYPDDSIQRPVFDPCLSACAATGNPEDCCTGKYDDPNVCTPSLYSENAKTVCPDAYSYAFDDQTSTFIIPNGGGWEVVFCPRGRSTNILRIFGEELRTIASGGGLTREILERVQNRTYIESVDPKGSSSAMTFRPCLGILAAVAVLCTVMVVPG